MNTINSNEQCVLIVEVNGDENITDVVSREEILRGVERGLSRALRSVEVTGGKILLSAGRRIIAYYERCDTALSTAQDIRQRISRLPPVSNVMLSMRVGLHTGLFDFARMRPSDSVIELACQIVLAASPNQILFSQQVAEKFAGTATGAELTSASAMIFNAEGQKIGLYEHVIPIDPPRSATQTSFLSLPAFNPAPSLASSPQTTTIMAAPFKEEGLQNTRLMVRYRGGSFIVSETFPVLLAGREDGNDLIVADRRASRQHARIEWRQGYYLLIDSNSSNGTYVMDEAGKQVVLRRNEKLLPKSGSIGFGYPPQEKGVDPIHFEVIFRQ